MTEYVYGDVLFVINFSMDFLCLYIAGKLSHTRMRTWRVVLGAAMGAVFGVVSLTYSLPTAVEIMIEIMAAFLICAVALWQGRAVRLLLMTALFYGASVLLGGAMTLLYSKLGKYKTYIETGGSVKTAIGDVPLWVFALCAALSAVMTKLLSVLLKRKNAAKTCALKMTLGGKTYELSGFVDSGNVCTEPISETPVIFLSKKYGASARGSGTLEKGVFAVPVSTAAGGGIVFAIKPDALMIKTRGGYEERRALVAAGERDDYDGCDALVPLDLL